MLPGSKVGVRLFSNFPTLNVPTNGKDFSFPAIRGTTGLRYDLRIKTLRLYTHRKNCNFIINNYINRNLLRVTFVHNQTSPTVLFYVDPRNLLS